MLGTFRYKRIRLGLLAVLAGHILSGGALHAQKGKEDCDEPEDAVDFAVQLIPDHVAEAMVVAFDALTAALNAPTHAGTVVQEVGDAFQEFNRFTFNYPRTFQLSKTGAFGYFDRVKSIADGPEAAKAPKDWAKKAVGVGFALLGMSADFPDAYHETFTEDLIQEHGQSPENAAQQADLQLERMEDIQSVWADNPVNLPGKWNVYVLRCSRLERPRGKPDGGRVPHKTYDPKCLFWRAISDGPSSTNGKSVYAPSSTDCVQSCTITSCPILYPKLDTCKCKCFPTDETIDVTDDPWDWDKDGPLINPLNGNEYCIVHG